MQCLDPLERFGFSAEVEAEAEISDCSPAWSTFTLNNIYE